MARNEYDKVWTVIQDGWTHTDVRTHLVEDYPTIRDLAGESAYIVAVKLDIKKNFRARLCFLSCVEIAKGVLGIGKPFIVTPYQLYRYLNGQ